MTGQHQALADALAALLHRATTGALSVTHAAMILGADWDPDTFPVSALMPAARADELWPTPRCPACPAGDVLLHCDHWYAGDACCGCRQTGTPDELHRLAFEGTAEQLAQVPFDYVDADPDSGWDDEPPGRRIETIDTKGML